MLSELQDHLKSIYRVDPGYRVDDFLITDPLVAEFLGKGSLIANTEESVLLQEDDEGLSLSVYLDSGLLSRLKMSNPMRELQISHLNDLWVVLEGISHFNYIAWNARKDRRVSLLELEMQAEVDKFVSTLFLALHQDDCDMAGQLHGWLFGKVKFNPNLNNDQRERYSMANNYAARFCHGLCQRIQRSSRQGLHELRRFYRLTQREKISFIHSQSYAH